jgi:hypothetical protein
MKFPLFLATIVTCAYCEVVITSQAPTVIPAQAAAIVPNEPSKSNLVQEIVIGNKAPIDVKVINFEPIEVQKVKLDSNDSINVKLDSKDTVNVVVSNEIKVAKKRGSSLLELHEGAGVVTIENSAYLGALNTDSQNIFVHKTEIKSALGEQSGLVIKFVADDKLEISKDIKIIVENEVYVDAKEIPALQMALAKMLSVANEPNESKEYKIVFNFLDDAQISSYSVKKMLSSSKGNETLFIIGKDEKYVSKTVMTPKELAAFKAVVDKFASTVIESI